MLCILDGFGSGPDYEFNAVTRAVKPNLDKIFNEYPHTLLSCSGFEVGLPKGTMGNSEVGHLNIGAGRVVFQDIARIHKSIEDGEFGKNEVLNELFESVRRNDSSLHIQGLLSDGDVHSSFEHLKQLIISADKSGLKKVYIHAFTDGRDTPPESAIGFIRDLEIFLKDYTAKIASVSGRYYSMDRDNRWERIKAAYDVLTDPVAVEDDLTAEDIIKNSYSNGITDEFIKPCAVCLKAKPLAKISNGDSVIFFNYRADRAREISIALNCLEPLPFETKKLDLNYVTMTEYREDFPFKVLYPKVYMNNILGEVVSDAGLKQLRIAETEKYAHVTFFFNGGDEKEFPGEERILIPSPKVATYDMQPEMSANEVCESVLKEMDKDLYSLIILNFANCDMVGHTGIFEAAKKAVETVDRCMGKIFSSAIRNEYILIITADHGNAEYMMDGSVPFTAHTKNKVPFLITKHDIELQDGKLGDIAPTILKLMDLEIPTEMTGKVLFRNKIV
ncbi:MAG TPA: 2,3-bisphosphoglycerate-independent phosphoglycerate mutase [Clostridiales bacterium]|nr:2,3-bisphosphoglycerate-independent phosphoglycerate mutase [Clostridiales bacterium]HQP69548.1 2,3-bisphosphoglycerate-independent phosphoglycerate mutase [Clostridiales bacterium]